VIKLSQAKLLQLCSFLGVSFELLVLQILGVKDQNFLQKFLSEGSATVLRTEPTSVLALPKILGIRNEKECMQRIQELDWEVCLWINKAKVILPITQYMCC